MQLGWAPFYDVLRRFAGPEAIDVIGTYWRLGDLGRLAERCYEAGLHVQETATHRRTARFGSVEEFVATEVDGTPLRAQLSEATYAAILEDAQAALAAFRTLDGQLELPIEGHILLARPRHGVPARR